MENLNILIAGGMRPDGLGLRIGQALVKEDVSVTLTTSDWRKMRVYEKRLWREEEKKFFGQFRVSTGLLDVSNPRSIYDFFSERRQLGRRPFDGMVYAVAGGPENLLGGLKVLSDEELVSALTVNVLGLHNVFTIGKENDVWANNASFAGLSGSNELVFNGYGWMGPLKQMLAGLIAQMSITYPGYRFNLIESGPVATMAAKAIPGFEDIVDAYNGINMTEEANISLVTEAAVALLKPTCTLTNCVIQADGGLSGFLPVGDPHVIRRLSHPY